MEIKDLILLMWRNIRVIVLGLVLGAGIGVFLSIIQSPVYEASTKVFVSRARQQSNSDVLSLSDEQLLAINLQLAKSQTVLNAVSSQLGSKVDVDNIQAGALPNTLIVQIKIQDTDPQRATTIANLLVQELIQQNEFLLSEQYTGFENAIIEQIEQVQQQIDDLQIQISQINNTSIQEQQEQVNQEIEQLKAEISSVEQEIAGLPDILTPLERILLAEKEAQLDQLHSLMTLYQQIQTNLTYIGKPIQSGSSLENPELATLQSTLSLYQQMNTTLINSRESTRLARTQSKQNVVQIVSATLPKKPVRPIPALYILLGGVVGLTLTATAVLVIDHLDSSIKTASQLEELLGLPILGFVFGDKTSKSKVITSRESFSAEAGSFRAFGASVEIVGADKNVRTIMILNAESLDAKTSIAANLAVVNAQQGKQVILLDGDLKHPHLHTLFGLENQNGLAELLNGNLEIKDACHVVKNVQGLTLVPGGISEKDSTVWLDAKKMQQLVLGLQNEADLVIVDGPPVDTADAQILACYMNAVILAIRLGHTRIDSAQASLKRFQLIGATIIGVVLNRMPRARKSAFKLYR